MIITIIVTIIIDVNTTVIIIVFIATIIIIMTQNMKDKEQDNSPSVATVVASIAGSADIAEGDDIVGVGHKATQEDKGQHSTRACKH